MDANGNLLWQKELKTLFGGKGTDFGYACSPTVIDGKVIMPVGGEGASMVALNADSGEMIWKSGDSSASYTPALPIIVDGHKQIIGYMEHDIVAFDLQTGAQLWQQTLSRGYDEHSAWPIFEEPHLWTASPFQAGSQLLKLSGGENAKFDRVWQTPVMSNDVSSCVLVDGYLYGFDLAEAQTKAHRPSRGSFRCIDFVTGTVMWSNGDAKKRRSTDFSENAARRLIGHANVIVADNKLILFNDLGDLILAKVDPTQYTELSRTPALGGEICWTTPALDRGRIFLRNHSRAVCLFIGEPELMNPDTTARLLTVHEIPQGSVRDWSSVLGIEPEYAMDPPTKVWLTNWFWAAEAILIVAGIIASLMGIRVRRSSVVRWSFWMIAMVLGLTVGAPASRLSGDFIFTWPVTIFIAFQIAIYQCSLRRSQPAHKTTRLHDKAIAFGFIATCCGYFWLCRHLSLVTEWIFLCGFGAALPFFLIGRSLRDRLVRYSLLGEFLLTMLAYASFHLATSILLATKYEISRF